MHHQGAHIQPDTQQTSRPVVVDRQPVTHTPWPYVAQQPTRPVLQPYANANNTHAMHPSSSQPSPTNTRHPSNQVPPAQYDVREGNLTYIPVSIPMQRSDHIPVVPPNPDFSNALILPGPPVVPTVKDMVDAVLTPTHSMLSNAWRETATRVQSELQSVHTKYTDLLRYEKNITEQAVELCKVLRAELDAAQVEKSKLEAERNEALAEVNRLRAENEKLKKQVENMVHVGVLKSQIGALILERKRFQEEWNLSRTLRLQLQQENSALKDQLSKNYSTGNVGLSTSPCLADGNYVAKESVGPAYVRTESPLPSPKERAEPSSRPEFVSSSLQGAIEPSAKIETDGSQELQYPSASEEGIEFSGEEPEPFGLKAEQDSKPLSSDNMTTSTYPRDRPPLLNSSDSYVDNRPPKRARVLYDVQS